MSKNTKTLLIVGAVAVAAFIIWRIYSARKAATGAQSPTGSFGSNLNSIAPELVAGSSGPSSGPTVSLPVTINVTGGERDGDKGTMFPLNNTTISPLGVNPPVPQLSSMGDDTSMESPMDANAGGENSA